MPRCAMHGEAGEETRMGQHTRHFAGERKYYDGQN